MLWFGLYNLKEPLFYNDRSDVRYKAPYRDLLPELNDILPLLEYAYLKRCTP
jgi:hypothetical protein